MSEALHVRGLPDDAACDVHEWPTEGMPARLVAEMRAKHGHGGVNACVECVTRARDEAARNAGRAP